MFEPSSVIAGLEIGTSKICVVVGELNDAGTPNIIGLGQSRSRGVRKGEITDPATASEDIRHALVEAEEMANVEIRSVYLAATGAHIAGFNNRGVHPVVSDDREITAEDVDDVIKNAKAINLPRENSVIHSIRQHFVVDGQDGIVDPVGMLGSKLAVDLHVVHGVSNRLQNPVRAVKELHLEVEAVVFSGLASALAILSPEQKELGALVIDLGGGATEYVVYSGGIIKHSGVLAVGGDHVSNDLAYGLKVPLGRAEALKLQHGSAFVGEADKGLIVHENDQLGLPMKPVNLEHLRKIMSLRLDETLELIERDIASAGLLDYLRAGIFVCGGGSHIPGIEKLVEQIFQLPAAPGRASNINGLKSALEQPEFATAIGLVRYGAAQQKKRPRASFAGTIKETLDGLLRRR